MINIPPSYEVNDAEDLNKYLLGTLKEIKRNEISMEKAEAISKIADKAVKLNLIRILYKKLTKSDEPIKFFESTTSQTLIESVNKDE